MTNKQANFCCDCEYAKKTGFLRLGAARMRK